MQRISHYRDRTTRWNNPGSLNDHVDQSLFTHSLSCEQIKFVALSQRDFRTVCIAVGVDVAIIQEKYDNGMDQSGNSGRSSQNLDIPGK